MTEAYPLHWPEGWPRTSESKRKGSPFRTTFIRARDNLNDELRRLGAKAVVISSWLPLRNDGQPRADFTRYKLEDPGVAVYFTLRGKQLVMARDAYWSVHENLHSIGLAIQGLRQMERHGGAEMMDRAFSGFQALPAPVSTDFRTVLGPVETLDQAEISYRAKAKARHPDAPGGSHEKMAELNAAISAARKVLK